MRLMWICCILLLTAWEVRAGEEESEFQLFTEHSKTGLKNAEGKIIIPAKYDTLGWSEGEFKVVDNVIGYKDHEFWGILSLKNQRVTQPGYTYLSPISDELIKAGRQGKKAMGVFFGLLNTRGKTELDFEYVSLVPHGKLFIAGKRIENQFDYGVIHASGKVIIPLAYPEVKPLFGEHFLVREKNLKYAIYRKDGLSVTPFMLDSLRYLDQKYAKVYSNGQVGLVDASAFITITINYKSIRIFENGSIEARPFPNWQIYDNDLKQLNSLSTDKLIPFASGWKKEIRNSSGWYNSRLQKKIPVRSWDIVDLMPRYALIKTSGKYALYDTVTNNYLIPPLADTIIYDQSREWFIAGRKGKKAAGRYVLMSYAGDTLSKKSYHLMEAPSQGLFPVQQDGFWGLISITGKEVIPCKYDAIEEIAGNLIKVRYLGSHALLDRKNNWIAKPQRYTISLLTPTTYMAETREKTSIYNLNGKLIYTTFNKLYPETYVMRVKNREGKYGMIDRRGVQIYFTEYDSIYPGPNKDFFYLIKDGKLGICAKDGSPLVPPVDDIERIWPPTCSYFMIKRNGRYGFVDQNGKLRIAYRYDEAKPYGEDLAPVKLIGKWGYIDKIDRISIQPQFMDALPFEGELAAVKQKEGWGLIDKDGELVLETYYDSLQRTESGCYYLFKNGEIGYANAQGKVQVRAKYNQVTPLENGRFIIARDKQYGLLDASGLPLLPEIHHAIYYHPMLNQFVAAQPVDWQHFAGSTSDP